jgi:hypothetical protein
MKLLHRYSLLFASALYLVLFFVLLPLHQYVFDVDGTGYSTVANHVAAGNFERAVNGFWSPLHSWLVAPFVNTGISIQVLFFYSNAILSLIILFLMSRLCGVFSIAREWITATLFTVVILLLQFSFHELAADILVLPFILGWLLLVLRKDFYTNTKLQIWCGVLVGLGYLAKTYALPFLGFIHMILLLQHFYFQKQSTGKQFLFFLIPLLIVCIPWIAIISNKYGFFTIGNSSRLNLSWFLRGMTNENAFFHAPEYAQSYSWWEDPSYFKGEVVNLFTSGTYFLKQIKVFLHNCIVFVKLLLDISILSPFIIAGVFRVAVKNKDEMFRKLSIFLIIFPAGYLLTFVDDRYLWIFNLLLLTTGFFLLQTILKQYQLKPFIKSFTYIFFFLSFAIRPILKLEQNISNPQWKQIHTVANWFKQHQITGRFTSNKKSAQTMVTAFLSGTRFYQLSTIDVTTEQISGAMEETNISHLLYYFDQEKQKQSVVQLMQQKGYSMQQIEPGVLLFSRNK